MDYKIVQNALSICVALCRLHTNFTFFFFKITRKYKQLKDEIQNFSG